MSNKLPFYIVRGFFVLVCAGIGIYGAVQFHHDKFLLYYILVACGIAVGVVAVEMRFSRTDISTLSSVVFGLVIGLVLSVLFQPVIQLIAGAFGYQDLNKENDVMLFLQLVSTALFCYFGITILLHTRGRFKFIVPYVEFRRESRDSSPLILDTSVLIDGRIESLLESGVVNCSVLLPSFVIEELHALSDSSVKLKRERGRRGLEYLERLRNEGKIDIIQAEGAPGEVDARLLNLAVDHSGWVMTTDSNLVTRGGVQGIKVVNLNTIASAIKMQMIPGDVMQLSVLRKGEEAGQGVAFCPDGTMVVIENGATRIGKTVDIEVTSIIKTSGGKMVFAKLKE